MTQYHVLVLQRTDDDGPLWRYLGPIDAGSAEAAKIAALGREKIETATVQATPDRSWNPELFTLKSKPQYIKGSAAARV